MPTDKDEEENTEPEKTDEKPDKKPIELWLAVLGLGSGILFYLLPKTPPIIIVSLFLMFLSFGFVVWNALKKFYWHKRACICILLIALVMVGFYVWPTVTIEPSEISISSNIGEAVTIRNNRTEDIYEVYVRIDSLGNGCIDIRDIEVIPEMTDENKQIVKIPGLEVDMSHIPLWRYCDTDHPLIHLMIYRLRGLESRILQIKRRDTERKDGQLDLNLTIDQFSDKPPRPVNTNNGDRKGLVLNLPGNDKPIAVTLYSKEKNKPYFNP